MKYANWALVYANDANNDSYDKHAQSIVDMTIDSKTDDESLASIKKEPNLIFLSVEPISGNIQILHHLTILGGSIAMPDSVVVALKGFSSLPVILRLDDDFLTDTDSTRVPSWSAIEALTTPDQVSSTVPDARNTMTTFRNIIAIPPFLAKTITSSTSMDPADILIDCLTSMKAFDTAHAADADFPASMTTCRRIIYFLYAVAHSIITPVVTIIPSNGPASQFLTDIQDRNILTSTAPTPSAGAVSGPSDKTLSNLAGNIQNLTSRLETDSKTKQSDKDDKKDKFNKLPSSSQRTILYASMKADGVECTKVNPELESFLQQTSLSRARTHLNQVLASFGCQIDASSILVASIMAGDFLWSRTSHVPEKFTIFLMGKPSLHASNMTQKDWLKMHLQELNKNSNLDDSIIDKIASIKFEYPKNLNELRHFLNNMVGMCRLIFSGDSAIAVSVSTWIDHVDNRELLYEMQFASDPLFGLKICLTVDRSIQLFLTSCQDAPTHDKVLFRYLDFSFETESIEKGRFNCNPPPQLISIFNASNTPLGIDNNASKRRRRNALGDGNPDNNGNAATHEVIQNMCKNPNWILKTNEEYTKVFPRAIWSENPPPPITNNSRTLCCPRWNGKGYCFRNCNRSHDDMDPSTTSAYDRWQKARRSAAN